MSSHAATLKRGAILASIVVSSYAVFGHDAWAPEPAQLTNALGASSGATAAAVYVNTGAPTTVVKWPGTWTAGSPASGAPCSTVGIPAGTIADKHIARIGAYRKCMTWINVGARLNEGESLSEIYSIANAVTLGEAPQGVTVVLFPASWTYDTTLAAETHCATWPAQAGEVVGSIIVRNGDYAKCSH